MEVPASRLRRSESDCVDPTEEEEDIVLEEVDSESKVSVESDELCQKASIEYREYFGETRVMAEGVERSRGISPEIC